MFVIFPPVSFRGYVFPKEVVFAYSQFLSDADFSNSRFEIANFSQVKFKKVNFRRAIFGKVSFRKAVFEEVNFRYAEFDNADFKYASFGSACFKCAKFGKSQFKYVDFEVIDFRNAYFQKDFYLSSNYISYVIDFTGAKFSDECKVIVRHVKSTLVLLNNLILLPNNILLDTLSIINPTSYIKEKYNNRYKNRANLEIVSSNLSKAKFVNCDFSGAERIRIENSDLTDVRFLATDWGYINEKRICPELFEKEPKKARDIYRQLKLTLDNHKDFVSANGFYALEMKAQEKILEQSMEIYREGEGIFNELKSFFRLIRNFGRLPESKYELLVLKIHRISSNFGQSWVRPLLWLFFFSLLFSFYFHFDEWSNLIKVNYLNFGDSSLRVMDFVIGLKVFCCKLLTAFSIPLQMVAEITKVVKGEFSDSNPVVVASRLLYTVVAGFLIYQFGGAVRRRVKR